ncbi:MAG TPA: class I SAM-dependent methyltransferase [Candidatus Syntrophoarchaeum butanivorans]|uniref:Class I SAM-dependent methyltransferase n=1 Tax=Candidatus Syntropharchaeum butanivorans TaxID=1839936 RepID=A0A1F2P735_9EURY|nr:MAG: type 11 methyltransferase [Candidatus Syntrophoarchaeum butanivorans]HEC56626.1 class I SAM-dependent methyltransferase [Candidatus Syntrophoarchaeum butanivorans]
MPKVEPFEKYTSKYEDWFERNKFAYESEIRAIKMLLPRGKSSLEIGVGSGRFAGPLGIEIGVEPSRKMGKIAQQRGIKVIYAVAENLPFADSQFDSVLMVTTVCFLDNTKAAFREAYRVLKSGGGLVIGFIDKESPVGRLYRVHKNESVFYREATFYSVKEIVSYLKEIGFKDFSFMQTIFNNLSEIKEIEPIKEGYGEGSFVVVRAMK